MSRNKDIIETLNALESQLLKSLFYKDFDSAKRILKKESSIIKPSFTLKWLLDDIDFSRFSPSIKKKLLSKGISKNIDVAFLEPLRIEDYSIKPLSKLKDSDYCAVEGVVHSIKRTRKLFLAVLQTPEGFIICRWFHINGFIRKILTSLKIEDRIVCKGQVKIDAFGISMNHPVFEPIDKFNEVKRIVYPTISRMRNDSIKRVVDTVLSSRPKEPFDYLPYTVIVKNKLLLLNELVEALHSKMNIEDVRRRLKYEELFLLILSLRLQERQLKQNSAPIINVDNGFLNNVINHLEFKLTASQLEVINEALRDFQKSHPMLRLLQGDVGSGKTIVALILALVAVKNGFQAAFMAPTQPLAIQIFNQAKALFDKYGFSAELLLSSTKDKQLRYDNIRLGNVDLVVGTHAILQEDVTFKRLGFIVIDEQHRFGVEQRKCLMGKGYFPHVLIMSATPIPRSLSMVLYSKSSLSTIREKPKGRREIKTLHFYENNAEKAYELAKEEMLKKHQVYVVAPLIESSEAIEDIKNVEDLYRRLKDGYFADFNVAFLHGRMKPKEKDDIVENFRRGKIDCLVSTTVIEVGIDAPNATVIIIEDAHRFGLSQLHQLRGRVGRGFYDSYAVLITKNDLPDITKKRIDAVLSTDDGFKISQLDYELRGAGEIFGIRQHGKDLVYTDLIRDAKLIGVVKDDVDRLIKMGYPINDGLKLMMEYKWKTKINYIYVG